MPESTERTVVKTYVPAHQKEEWRDHADALGMTQSEFVRTMVQAGRRGFGAEPADGDASVGPGDSSPTPQDAGDGLAVRERVLELLEEDSHSSFEELRDAIVGDLEADLDDALQSLQADGRIRYSGREDGYAVADR